MHHWAREGLLAFNLLMFYVDAAVLWHLYRSRSAAAWWRAGIVAGLVSMFLVSLFTIGPSWFSEVSVAGHRTFPFVRLVAYVLFLHGPICLLGGALLLRKTARKTAFMSALGVVGLMAVAADAFLVEPAWLDVTHVRIETPKVDRPLRLAVLADIQTDSIGDYERRVFERLMAEKPDVILLAGDYVHCRDWRDRQCERVARKLNRLMREVDVRAPEGVFAVQGNVDNGYTWRQLFVGLPVVPVGATHSFDVGPIQLTCLSMRSSFNRGLQIEREDPDRFHVVLGHCPNFALGKIDADLLLAGHTHGGQVRLPLVGALTNGCAVPKEWAAGTTELPGGAKLIVSRGVGMERGHAPRLRFLCRPELVIIDLTPSDTAED